MRVSRPLERDEGPAMKKFKYDRNRLPHGKLYIKLLDRRSFYVRIFLWNLGCVISS